MNLFDVVPALEKLSMDQVKEAFETLKNEEAHTSLQSFLLRKTMAKNFALIVGASGEIGQTISRKLAEARLVIIFTLCK